jgi:hypothetical protein
MRRQRARERGQALTAVVTVAALAAALALLSNADAAAPGPAVGGRAPSGGWVCPHGGGEGWSVSVFLANPGPSDSVARVSSLGERAPDASTTVEVPAGETVRVPATAEDRGSATFVEFFGGWIGAGWVTTSDADDGLAAEPCAAEASTRWLLPDGSTRQDEDSFVVIANPFDAQAVLDVVVRTADRAPVRPTDWTDLVVRPRRSIAIRVDTKVEGEDVAAVQLDVSAGRVAAASLVVTDGTRIRSALGTTTTATGAILPVIGGSGQAELVVVSVADRSIRFQATALSDEPPEPAGGFTGQDHAPQAAQAYAVPVDAGPTAIRLFVLDGGQAAAALRALGPGADLGSTSGASASSDTWVVFPAGASDRSEPALVLVNDGGSAVVATLELLGSDGGTAAAPITVDVAPHAAAAVPREFLASAPGSAVLLRTEGGGVVALSAASSAVEGRRGGGAFALSVGVPVPQRT